MTCCMWIKEYLTNCPQTDRTSPLPYPDFLHSVCWVYFSVPLCTVQLYIPQTQSHNSGTVELCVNREPLKPGDKHDWPLQLFLAFAVRFPLLTLSPCSSWWGWHQWAGRGPALWALLRWPVSWYAEAHQELLESGPLNLVDTKRQAATNRRLIIYHFIIP